MKINKACRLLLFKVSVLLLITLPYIVSAQKVRDVLGVNQDQIIGGRDKFLLKFNGSRLEYDFWRDQRTKFIPLKDSVVFLSKQSTVLVYMKPLNPLNYSMESKLEFIPSPIDQEANAVFEQITKALTDITGLSKDEKAKNKAAGKEEKQSETSPNIVCKKIDNLIARLKNVQDLLKKDQKADIVTIFKELKQMTFDNEQQTDDELKKITPKLEPIETHFGDVRSGIEDLERELNDYDCPEPHPFVINYIFSDLITKSKAALKTQTNRFNNLKECLDLVTKAFIKARSNDEGMKWIVEFKDDKNDNTIEITRGMVANFSVIINESGYTLSDNDEIVAQVKKVKVKSLVRIMKFQRFVPEIIPGIAYTFLQYPKFGTTKNGSDQEVVSEAGTEDFKKMNFSAMVNFDYFVSNSIVNPFCQIGIGANSDYPTFFFGGGLRFDLGSGTVKALCISGGLVSTWIKTLTKLKLGDAVSGTAELENDLSHEFKWPPKPYIGIQLKF